MDIKTKEEVMVLEVLEGISERNKIFAEALDNWDMKTMLAAFITEQHRHFLSVADSVNDPEMKILLLDYATTMGVEVKEALEQLRDSR